MITGAPGSCSEEANTCFFTCVDCHERGAALGEMREDQISEAVAMLVSLTLGVGVLMRAGASHGELAAHFAAAHAAVESWRQR